MSRTSTPTAYGTVAVTVHWISAILVVAAIGSGFRAASMTDAAAKTQILAVHVPLAITVLLLTLFRLFWWWRHDSKPQPLDGPAWEIRAARTVHVLLYVVILGMAASGIGLFVLSGAGPVVFAGAQGPLPDFAQYPPRVPHGIGAFALVALLLLHVAAALNHHFIRRDATLKRIWFGAQ